MSTLDKVTYVAALAVAAWWLVALIAWAIESVVSRFF